MTALAHASRRPADARPAMLGLVVDQLGHAARELWRSRLVLVFTFVLPVTWLVLIGLLAGNAVVDPATGVRTMQFVTPMAAVLGIVFAAFPPVATNLALTREQQVMKRLQGTPLPIWAYLLGQVGAALLLAGVALVVMLAIGVVAYDVQVQWRTALASAVTILLGTACLASLGLAVGALASSASTAQTFAMASAVAVSFVSGLFNVDGHEPGWMAPIGRIFPIRNIADPLSDQFNPYLSGGGWDLGALAVLLAWGAGALLVAGWALRRSPGSSAAPSARQYRGDRPGRPGVLGASLRFTDVGRPGVLRLVADQAGWALRWSWRNPSLVVFAIAMPVGLYALMCSMYAGTDALARGMPFGVWFAAGMTAYGAGVIAFMNMPVAVATARDRAVLSRLRGTPLPSWSYLAGRTTAAIGLAVLVGILILVTGSLAFEVRVPLEALPAAAAVLVFGGLTMAACGFALVALVPTGRAAASVAMAILLPLAFVSDIFVLGAIPEPIPTLAALLPLRHFVGALAATLNPAGWSLAWADVAVMAAWLVGAALVAVRRFRWEASPGSPGRAPARRSWRHRRAERAVHGAD